MGVQPLLPALDLLLRQYWRLASDLVDVASPQVSGRDSQRGCPLTQPRAAVLLIAGARGPAEHPMLVLPPPGGSN
jgi:hypothetical protein